MKRTSPLLVFWAIRAGIGAAGSARTIRCMDLGEPVREIEVVPEVEPLPVEQPVEPVEVPETVEV